MRWTKVALLTFALAALGTAARSETSVPEPELRAAVAEVDKNKDGQLDEGETAARDKERADRQKRYMTAHKEFDKDGDGKLNEEEEKAHRAKHGNRGGRSSRGRGRPGGGDR